MGGFLFRGDGIAAIVGVFDHPMDSIDLKFGENSAKHSQFVGANVGERVSYGNDHAVIFGVDVALRLGVREPFGNVALRSAQLG